VAEAQMHAVGQEQAGALGGVEGRSRDAQRLRRPQDGAGIAGVVAGGEQEQPPRVVAQREHARQEGALDALRQRQVEVERRAAGALVGGQRGGQLVQGQRVAAGGADELVAHRRRQLGGLQQGDRLALAEPAEGELRQPRRLEPARLAVARGD
jgi:hypothetical protein